MLYSPQNELIDDILSHVEDEILILGIKITAVNDSKELECIMKMKNYFAAIEFPDEYRVIYKISVENFGNWISIIVNWNWSFPLLEAAKKFFFKFLEAFFKLDSVIDSMLGKCAFE